MNRGIPWAAIALTVLLIVVMVEAAVLTIRVPGERLQSTALQWDPRLDQLHITAEKADYSQPYFKLLRAWITVNGDWATAPAWAQSEQVFPGSGGDHHVFGRLEPGKPGAVFRLGWPDGQQFISPAEQGRAAWCDEPLYSDFDPVGPGPYSWGPSVNSERIAGLGLPRYLPWQVSGLGGFHVSYFFVWAWVQPAMPTATSAPTATTWPTLTPEVPQPMPTDYWRAYDLRLGPFTFGVELRQK